MENKQIKDGVGNLFTLRMHDVSDANDGTVMRGMLLTSPYPLDYGTGGMFQHTAKSGIMAAGLAAGSPIYSFRWSPSSPLVAVLRRVKIAAYSVTAFTPGLATFDLYAARSFTAQDIGGAAANLSGNAAKLRTSMSPSLAAIQCATTLALAVAAPGSRLLDPDPLGSLMAAVTSTSPSQFSASLLTLFDKPSGDHPLVLAANEGFVIQATVPAAGTWSFAVTTEWDEIPGF